MATERSGAITFTRTDCFQLAMKNKTVKRVKGWLCIWKEESRAPNDPKFSVAVGEKELWMKDKHHPYIEAVIPCTISYQIKAPRGKRTK